MSRLAILHLNQRDKADNCGDATWRLENAGGMVSLAGLIMTIHIQRTGFKTRPSLLRGKACSVTFVATAEGHGGGVATVIASGSGDPVQTELVASLAHPGDNVTGISDDAAALSTKRLGLLKAVRTLVNCHSRSRLGTLRDQHENCKSDGSGCAADRTHACDEVIE
jgi:hypothetical protein